MKPTHFQLHVNWCNEVGSEVAGLAGLVKVLCHAELQNTIAPGGFVPASSLPNGGVTCFRPAAWVQHLINRRKKATKGHKATSEATGPA